jgi:aryl-alcohol dehydrogenase-like predicted oxidoreductase
VQRRPLGSTGLEVTPIGLGLAALGRPAYIDLGRGADLTERTRAAMEHRSYEVLDAAYEAGIRYVDVARSYGDAERFLASWIAARPGVTDVTVGSKWGYTYVADWRLDADVHEVKDHSVEALRRQAPESLSLLGDRLALYQVHSATLESGVLDDAEVLDELRRLRAERGIAIGMSVSGPRQADTIRRALEIDPSPFRTVQATWNVLEPSAGGALAEAHAAGWGVLVKEALANGRLTARGGAAIAGTLEPIARAHGVGRDAVAIAAALANPWADVVLSGAVTVEQIRSNVAALAVELSGTDRERLGAAAVDAEAYWHERAALAWA